MTAEGCLRYYQAYIFLVPICSHATWSYEFMMQEFISWIEFKAVMVLPAITQNYCNYRYGNYVGSAPCR